MINITEDRELIKEIFRDVINEVIREERINFYHSIIPIASKSEIEDIENLYGSPQDYKSEDFTDMSGWER